jgi:hypothetical protein
MRRPAALLLSILALSLPAAATETMTCSAGEQASISVLLGAMDVVAVVKVDMEAGGKSWSTAADGVQRITVGQAFETADQMMIDLTDENLNTVVAQLRLFKASEADDYVSAGTLRVSGVGAFAVSCEGP